MLVLADFVNATRRNLCLKDRAFIAAHGGLSYCIVPEGTQCPAGVLFEGRYGKELFEDHAYATSLLLPTSDGRRALRLGLSDATFLLSFFADQPEWLARLRASDGRADDETIVRSFGIDPEATCRPSVGAWAAGEFLAPDAGGYAYFLVEPYGQVSVISRSESVLPVALHLASNREAQKIKLADRLGKIEPAPDDDR